MPRPPRLPAEMMAEVSAPASASSIEIALDVDDAGVRRASWRSLPPPAARFGRYGVLGRLAVGGMAEIFLSRDEFQGDAARHLILKVLRGGIGPTTPDAEAYFEAMFLREGRVAMQLSHPNICHTYEFGKWGGHYFIAMEWVEGLSVRSLMERACQESEMPVDVAVYIASQVAAALDYAHSARDSQRRPLGVVHRDVTPHNIMLRYDGVVKLLDFGVAKAERSEDESHSGTVKGKFGYMAPEQCAGRSLDGRADVFALGVCLFEMLSGRRLYQRGGQYETFRAIVEEPPPSLRELREDVPEALDAIVQRALAKSSLDRFDSAGDLQDALVSFAAGEGFVMSATRARRWIEKLYGDDLFTGPTLEFDAAVLARLAPADDGAPLSSSKPPPPMQTKTASNPSAEGVGRVDTDRSGSALVERWVVLGGALLGMAALWAWWLWGMGPE